MDWLNIIFDPQIQALITAALAAFIAWRERRKIKSAVAWAAGAGTAEDNRAELAEKLADISDHVQSLKCQKLRAKADQACVDLSEAIMRKPGYEEPLPEAKHETR